VHSAGTGVRLRIDHPLERLSLTREQVGHYSDRRACDGTAIEFQAAASARPDPYTGGHVCDVRTSVGGFRALHGQVLRDAEEGIRVRCCLALKPAWATRPAAVSCQAGLARPAVNGRPLRDAERPRPVGAGARSVQAASNATPAAMADMLESLAMVILLSVW